MDKEQEIFDLWNSFKGDKNIKRGWWTCRNLDGFTKATIRKAAKEHGGKENIMAAIKNYHTIWLSRVHKWTYTWNLCQFLTRAKRGIPQIRRFLPGNFCESEYITKAEENRRQAAEEAKAAKTSQRYDVKPMKIVPDFDSEDRKRFFRDIRKIHKAGVKGKAEAK